MKIRLRLKIAAALTQVDSDRNDEAVFELTGNPGDVCVWLQTETLDAGGRRVCGSCVPIRIGRKGGILTSPPRLAGGGAS